MSQAAEVMGGGPSLSIKPPRRRSITARIMLVLTAALGAFVGWQEAPREIARWYHAAALEHRLEAQHYRFHGDAQAASQELERGKHALSKGLAWNPRDGDLYLTRALWLEEEGEYEAALRDCQKSGVPYNSYLATIRTASVLTHLGRHQEAVREAQKTLEMSGVRRESALNLVAYHRALGKVDLPQALKEIERSFGKLAPAAYDAARLDTRGFILYRMGRYREAIVDFDRAVALVEAQLGRHRLERERDVLKAPDYRAVEAQELEMSRQNAVIYYHRSLVLQKLNRWKQANQDLRKAKELAGSEPDEHLF